jgi:predicted phosphodiesterase
MKKIILMAVCLLSCCPAFLRAEEASLFRTEPYLQNLAAESVTIMWHTEIPAYGWVEYGKTDAFGEKADRVVDGLRSANTTNHKVRLSALDPGATYHYRVCFKPIVKFTPYKVDFADAVHSRTNVFETVSTDRKRVSCVIFNDLHNNYALFNRLCDAVAETDYQFSIFNGDCFSDPKSETAVLEALTVYNEGVSADSRPPLFIRGNHETRGAFARDLKKMFDFQDDEYFFAATVGPIRFIFLDCGEDKADEHLEYSGLNDFTGYRSRQAEWLKKEVESDAFLKARHRVLVHHIPLYNHQDKGISTFSKALWAPVLDAAPIDIAIHGHTHKYDFIPAGTAGNPYPVLIGGGKVINAATVIVLSATDEQLDITVLNDNGEILNRYEKNPAGIHPIE